MINYVAYRKFATLKSGKRVMFRFLNEQDRDGLVQMFQEAPEEDTRFLKQDVKDLPLVNSWVDRLNYRKVLPLVAVDLENNRIIADVTLHRGKHAAKHIGEIRIFVSRAFRNLGLGSLMLEETLNLALQENLMWVKAEILAEHKKVIKAFRAKGFEQKAILDDYFLRKDGVTHDVVLMMRPVVKRDDAEF
jgi:RimJ/RimL family protein N-acetyltransferase